MKHTPTPWYVDYNDVSDYQLPIKHESGAVIADVCLLESDHVSVTERVDAEFILRACNAHDDLLAACERAIEVIDNPDHEIGCTCYAADLRAAIAKAKPPAEMAKAEK